MLQNYNITRIMEILFKEPNKEHYLIELSRKTRLAHTSVRNYLMILKRKGLIEEKKEKRGKRIFPVYISSINNTEYKKEKMLWNLIKIYDSSLISFLKDNLYPKSIVLFGSFSRGEDMEDSDIDIFLECKKKNINLKKYEKEFGRKIQLHFNDDFNKYPKELKNNIINGKILYGYLEVFR